MTHPPQTTSHPPKAAFFTMAFLALSSLAPAAYAYTTVGNPNDHNGQDLSNLIWNAYNSGATGVTIAPGNYTFTQATLMDPSNPSVTLSNPGNVYVGGFSRPFVIDAPNVTLVTSVTNYPGIECLYDSNLTIQGLTTYRGVAYGNQGVIKVLSSDSTGRYVDVQNDAGYPTKTNNYSYCTVLVGNSHVPRVGCPDIVADPLHGGSATDLSNGLTRVRVTDVGSWGDVTAQVGDYLVSPAAGQTLLGLLFCDHITVQDVTFLSSPGENTIYELNNSANRFLRDKITYGPPPPNATVAPMRSITSGLQARNDLTGPDVENCFFEGVGDDAFDLYGDYLTVYSVSGNTVTVDNDSFFWANVTATNPQPIRLSNGAGQYLDTTVSNRVTKSLNITDANGNPQTIQVDVLTLGATPPSNFAQSNSKASNPNMNCKNAKFVSDTVRDSRAHGVIARGDGDVIQDCTFINNLLPGLLVSVQGGSFSEGDYAHNVTVKNNVFINNPGMIIGGLGAPGNMNISVTGNVFSNTFAVPFFGATDNPSILAQNVVGLTITNNVFANLGQQSSAGGTHANSQHAVNIQNCSQVKLGNNLVTNPGASTASPVYAIDSASQQGITGMNAASFANKIYANEYLTLTNVGANLNLDDPNFSQQPTTVQLYPSDGVSAQNWQVEWLADGSCTLINQASNGLVLDDFGGGGINNDQGIYTANGGPNQEYWFIPSASSSYLIKSAYNGLYLDVHTIPQMNSNVWLQASSGASTQNWQATLAPASAGYGQPGTILTQGQYLVSPHAKCYLTQQTDGNLVLYSGTGPSNKGYFIGNTGYSDTMDGTNYYTIVQTDGNLVTYRGTPSARGAAVFYTNTYNYPGAYLAVTDDGHFQVLSTTGAVLYQRP